MGPLCERLCLSSRAHLQLTECICAIRDYEEIRDYCDDLELRSVIWRYLNAKDIAVKLREKEVAAKDPTHLLNVSLPLSCPSI